MKMSKKGVRGPFFVISDPSMILEWLATGTKKTLYSKRKIPAAERQVLQALLKHAPSSEEKPITLDDLVDSLTEMKPNAKISTLETQVRRIAAKLSGLMIFKRTQKSLLGARKQSCYELNSPEQAARYLEENHHLLNETKSRHEKSANDLPRHRQKALEAVKATLLQRSDINYPITEINHHEPWTMLMITQLMERCCRESIRDPREMIEAKLQIGKQKVDVVAHTSTRADLDIGGRPGLLAASDAQTVMAIITIAMQYIESCATEGKPIVNRIPLDVVALCKMLGKHTTGSGRESVVRSLYRIIYTAYTIKLQSGSEADQLFTDNMGRPVTEVDFQLLRDTVMGIDGMDKDSKALSARRWFTVSLNENVWISLTKGHNTRLVHPGLLQETNGYMQKLHAHIKLHTPADRPIYRSTTELYSYFGYKGGPKRFKEFLRKILLDKAGKPEDYELPEQGLTLDFYGYDILIKNDLHSGEGRLLLVISMSEEEKQRLQIEKQKLAVHGNPTQATLSLEFFREDKQLDGDKDIIIGKSS